MISNIDEIKLAADIQDIISQYVTLKQKGPNLVGLCPFHKEKTPSFTVSKTKGIFKCFGCGKSGDTISFLTDHNNLNYIESVRFIAERYHIPIEEDRPKKQYEKPVPRLTKLQPDTIEYFQKRGISNNTLLRFDITESTEWMPVADKDVRCICFNYKVDEQLVNIKFRGKGKDFKMAKNAELIFYNLDAIKDEDTAIIVEGEIDCLTMYEAGFYNTVSVPNGAATGQQQLKYLDNCWKYFEGKKEIIILTDNDGPGIELKNELARRLGKNRCFFTEYPPDCKDVNDVLIKHGHMMLHSMVEQKKRWPIDGIIRVEDVFAQVVDYFENGYPKGFDAGIGEFDNLLTFTGGLITVVTGQPGSGKSEFLDYVITSLAKKHNWKFSICSFENPVAIHVTKLMEKFTGKSFNFRKDLTHRMTNEEFEYAIFMTDQYFNFINILQVYVSIQGLLSKLTEVVLKTGVKGIVIDPWNYLEHKVPAGYTETQYISEALTLIKEFAVKTDTHVFIVAHPRKLQKDLSTKQYPVVTMYDISGSAHFFNKTDNGISVHRDFVNNKVDVYVQKIRFSFHGKIGYTSYSYDTFTRKYTEL